MRCSLINKTPFNVFHLEIGLAFFHFWGPLNFRQKIRLNSRTRHKFEIHNKPACRYLLLFSTLKIHYVAVFEIFGAEVKFIYRSRIVPKNGIQEIDLV